ncbi:PEP-CTERM sorting domain-containing protein [Rheinheimera salexigens]|uniref:Ice-binding protein C-terminal domain-containing protein n=1 Tax=Rheinheimera salexigens TaxID=1628148 RepID=A0A1E7Q725_9GAMM|nr:PEP-CTERM sorting domain-containing protein [Rheinheimera salexigens]OEY69994.1 hypothetical protein BI198_10775 [Rheinheimera salexigens]
MKNFKLASITAAALLFSSVAVASDMYIDLGTNSYDMGRGVGTPDANTRTAAFNEFGFSQLLATSIYDYSDGSIFGAFFDTNDIPTLTGLGLPASGTALDGVSNVNLVLPNCPAGQCDIDALSPLVPPLGSDNEGYLQTWDMQMVYTLNGTLTAAGGPQYTSGTIDIFFNDLNDDTNDRLILTFSVTGSDIMAANLNLYFDITYAEAGFLWIDNGSGTFVDASAGIASGNYARVVLDTNVNPPIPTNDQLLLVGTNAIRQATLDGSMTASVPEPASLTMLGLGLLGLAGVGRRQRKNKSNA